MFPLKTRRVGGYGFKSKTSYSSAHLGVDYSANYVDLFAPFGGNVVRRDGTQGGITLWFYPDNGVCKVMRFMHLSKVIKTGRVNEGDLIAITGNSGALSTTPHLHLDCSKTDQGTFWTNIDNFINPEGIDWSDMLPQDQLQGRLERDPDGKVWWWTPTGEWFANKWEYVVQRPDYKAEIASRDAQIRELNARLAIAPKEVIREIEKIVEVEIPKEIINTVIEQVEKPLPEDESKILELYRKLKGQELEMNWLKGKKTYIICALIAIGAVAQYLGYAIPEWAWMLLNAAGLGAVRDAIKR